MRTLFIYILLISFSYAGLNKPSYDEDLRYIHILFEWDQEPNAIRYNLQASTHFSFNQILLDIEEETTTYMDTDNFDWVNNYYWRVRAIYNDGSYGSWIGPGYGIFSTLDKELVDLDINIYDEGLLQDGIMMYSQFAPFFAVGVVDKKKLIHK